MHLCLATRSKVLQLLGSVMSQGILNMVKSQELCIDVISIANET
jgi:hypothetical protein